MIPQFADPDNWIWDLTRVAKSVWLQHRHSNAYKIGLPLTRWGQMSRSHFYANEFPLSWPRIMVSVSYTEFRTVWPVIAIIESDLDVWPIFELLPVMVKVKFLCLQIPLVMAYNNDLCKIYWITHHSDFTAVFRNSIWPPPPGGHFENLWFWWFGVVDPSGLQLHAKFQANRLTGSDFTAVFSKFKMAAAPWRPFRVKVKVKIFHPWVTSGGP